MAVDSYIFVVEVLQQLDLSQGPQTEHGVVKGGNLFDGDLLACGLVDGGAGWMQSGSFSNLGRATMAGTMTRKYGGSLPHDAVGALADNIENLILVACIEVARTGIGGCGHFRESIT